MRQLEYLVDKQHFTSSLNEFAGKIDQTALREIEVIHVYEQT